MKIKDPYQQKPLAKSRGTQRSYYLRGLFFLMNMFASSYV